MLSAEGESCVPIIDQEQLKSSVYGRSDTFRMDLGFVSLSYEEHSDVTVLTWLWQSKWKFQDVFIYILIGSLYVVSFISIPQKL